MTKMEWCLGQALHKADRKFFEAAKSLTVMRDASSNLLLARFKAVDGELNERCGLFGAATDYGSTASDLTDATKKMYREAAAALGRGVAARHKGARAVGQLA